MEAQAKYKHDGVTEEDTKQQLANALNKAIQLIRASEKTHSFRDGMKASYKKEGLLPL